MGSFRSSSFQRLLLTPFSPSCPNGSLSPSSCRHSIQTVDFERLRKRKSKDDVISVDGMDLSPSAARRPHDKKGYLTHQNARMFATLPKQEEMGTSTDSDHEGSDTENGASKPTRPRGYVSPFADSGCPGPLDKVARVMGTSIFFDPTCQVQFLRAP